MTEFSVLGNCLFKVDMIYFLVKSGYSIRERTVPVKNRNGSSNEHLIQDQTRNMDQQVKRLSVDFNSMQNHKHIHICLDSSGVILYMSTSVQSQTAVMDSGFILLHTQLRNEHKTHVKRFYFLSFVSNSHYLDPILFPQTIDSIVRELQVIYVNDSALLIFIWNHFFLKDH